MADFHGLVRAFYRLLPRPLREKLATRGIPQAASGWLLAVPVRIRRRLQRGSYLAHYLSQASRARRGLHADSASPAKHERPTAPPVTLLAWYLPQYHPVAENNRAWGRGFTDWHNVAKAVSQFEGHRQPRLPATLGYYDLRVEETIADQVAMAAAYGIGAFCFHFYSFGGKRVLERPLDIYLENRSGKLTLPFALCWANENWTRRWDGADNEVILAQPHGAKADAQVFEDMLPYLRDDRYFRVNGRPFVQIYRPGLIPDLARTLTGWRERAREEGIGELFLCACDAFGLAGEHAELFDGVSRFPPHGAATVPVNAGHTILNPAYRGHIFDYGELVALETDALRNNAGQGARAYFPGVMPGWDNEARRPGAGMVYVGSSPDKYREWLEAAIRASVRINREGERLVFINAWNEWAEGAYLEPDRDFGFGFLEATADALERSGIV